MITKQDIRRKLPGFKQETMLVGDRGRELWHVLDIRGCFDELIEASCYQIRTKDTVLGGERVTCYGTIQQAMEAWL